MKLLRLKLRHFRGISEREIEFAREGVTLVTGPNEIGKSSFAEALDLLFDEVDSARKQRVRGVKPVDRDEGSEIEADFEVGPFAFTYTKRFHRSPYTSLRVTKPRVENHTGREAHDRAQEILEACIDTDLWKALRVQQGESLHQEAVGGSTGLAAALDAAAGVSAEGDRERSLLAAAESERDRYFTPGGREKIEIRRSAELAEAAGEALRACELRLEKLEGAVAREALLTQEIDDAGAAERAAESTLRRVESDHEKLVALREVAERGEAARELALAHERQALGEWKQRSQLLSNHAGAESEGAELSAALEESAPPLIAARGELEHTRGILTAAREARSHAQHVEETLGRDLEFHRGVAEHATLERRLARIDAANAELLQARAQLEETPALSTSQVNEIRDAELALERARARLEAEGPRVRFAALRDQSFELDGRSVHIAAGDVMEERLAEFLSLSIEGVGDLSVVAGAGAAERRKRLEESETTLRSLCVEAQVNDHAGAVQAFETRRDAKRRLKEAESRLAENLGKASRETLRARMDRLAERIQLYPLERDAEIELAPDLDAASASLEVAAAATRLARRAYDDAESRERSVRERAERLGRERHDTEVRLRLAQENLTLRGAQLEAARLHATDEVLSEARDARAAAAREAEACAREASQALAACEPDVIEQALARAQAARSDAARRLRDAREEHREVRGLIAGQSDEGLHEQRGVLHAEALAAEREYQSLARRAAAAQRLHATLCTERESARAGFAAPLRRHIESLGRELFGDDFGVTLSDELEVIRRQHEGIDLPAHDLSAGAREQLAILQRLALALAIAEPEGIPVLLDDALGHADPGRRAGVARLLQRVGERCQIIVLSCDPERYRELENPHVVTLD